MDEMWSFVGSKENKAWIGLAMDEATREIVGFDLGDHTRAGAWVMAVFAPCISPMRHVLHGLLGSLSSA